MQASLDKILNSEYVMIGLAGLAFLIALWLVIVIVRMLTGGRLRFSSARTRQARLGIVDAFDLDRQRQLIIVRRDNTEHLIMIGGPNDLVIESEIVRIEAREGRRLADKPDGAVENRIPAPIIVPDGAPNGGDEPLLPMVSPASAPAAERPMSERPSVPFPGSPSMGPIEPLPPRTPTFPLPRRQPPAPPLERRPPPPPESVSRMDEPAMAPSASTEPVAQVPAPRPEPVAAPEPGPAPEASFPPPPPIPPQPLPPIVPTQGTEVAPRTPVRPPPLSFLKPLPPRPPIRPLRRATPVAPAAPGVVAPTPGSPDNVAAPPLAEPRPPTEAAPISTPPLAPVPAAAPPAAENPPHPAPAPPSAEPAATSPSETKPGAADALESLEEEMAKLLGRG